MPVWLAGIWLLGLAAQLMLVAARRIDAAGLFHLPSPLLVAAVGAITVESVAVLAGGSIFAGMPIVVALSPLLFLYLMARGIYLWWRGGHRT